MNSILLKFLCGFTLLFGFSSNSLFSQNLNVNGNITFNNRLSGLGNTADSSYCTALGYGSWAGNGASINVALAAGYYATAVGVGSVAFNNNTRSSGTWSTAFGSYTTAPSYGEFVMGQFNLVPPVATIGSWMSTEPLFVVGNGLDATHLSNALTLLKDGTFSVGSSTVGTGITSFAVGKGTQATSYLQAVFGQYNALPSSPNATAWASADPLFVIGNGTTSTARSNAFTVLKSGAVLIKPSGDLSMGSYISGTQP